MSLQKSPSLFLAALTLGVSPAFPLHADEPLAAVAQTAPLEDNGTNAVEHLPVEVAPDSAMLYYSGRFDLSKPTTALCSWPASAVTLRFKGTGANARLGLGDNRFSVVLDGKVIKRLTGQKGSMGERLYLLAAGLPDSEHTITLFKNTEANVGDAAFFGFELAQGATVLDPIVPKRKIEVIGDSISAGYGNEGANQNENFSSATENAYMTYGAVAARKVGADYACFAWSGRTMWPTFTLPEIYNLTLPRNKDSVWGGEKVAPDVYLINLSTNEWNRKEALDQDGWVKAYKDFIGTLRAKSPNATIYCATSPMLSDQWPAGKQIKSNSRTYIQRVISELSAAGDTKIHLLDFETQNVALNGAGANWHPNIKTNQLMADQFVAALKADLGW